MKKAREHGKRHESPTEIVGKHRSSLEAIICKSAKDCFTSKNHSDNVEIHDTWRYCIVAIGKVPTDNFHLRMLISEKFNVSQLTFYRTKIEDTLKYIQLSCCTLWPSIRRGVRHSFHTIEFASSLGQERAQNTDIGIDFRNDHTARSLYKKKVV
jgi:hypothetical protein